MAKQFKDTESFVKAAGEKYKLTAQQKQYLRELAEKREKERAARKEKALKIICSLLVIGVILYIVWQDFLKPKPTFPVEDKLVMHFIDVGQGDCTFIAANGKTMLVDCGESEAAETVIDYLSQLGVRHLDHIIATHPHSDHMGGMSTIIDSFDVGEVIIPHIPDDQTPTTHFYEKFLDSCAAAKVKISETTVGTEFQLGDAHIEFIAPDGKHYDDLNNYSLSFVLTHGDNTFLLTGDAETESEAAMLKSGSLGKIDLYKAGHHGSAYSSTKELLEVIRPDIAVISCGSENPYGHPADSTVKRIRKYTKYIFRTDLNGSIIIESDGKKIAVTPERSFE